MFYEQSIGDHAKLPAALMASPLCLLFFQMQHFKDVEIAKVRMEEKEKFHKEFEKLKQELERTYEMKAKALMDREKNAIDRLQKQQEVDYYSWCCALCRVSTSEHSLAEAVALKLLFVFLFSLDWRKKCVHAETISPERNWNTSEQRTWAENERGGFWEVRALVFIILCEWSGAVLCDIKNITVLLWYRTCQIQEEKVKTTEELLRRRELAVKTMEETYDQRLRNELSRYF